MKKISEECVMACSCSGVRHVPAVVRQSSASPCSCQGTLSRPVPPSTEYRLTPVVTTGTVVIPRRCDNVSAMVAPVATIAASAVMVKRSAGCGCRH